jgi:hypothetical protein
MEDLKEEVKATAESLTEHVSDYVETYAKLAVVKVTEKATDVASMSLTAILLVFLSMLVLFFCGVGASIWLGESIDNMKVGFFIVGAAFLVSVLLVFLLRKKIIFPFVGNQIIRKVYEDHSHVS